ncbi:MAG TPA: SO_0444 family Cu/Zn efflux transporter, partial [bacterium]|nr:SO_0444 family Cu/Zn efflux transporter [bacterium]
MIDFLSRLASELFQVFLEASPYIILGFAVAAAIQIFLPVGIIRRFLGRGRARSIFAASILGVPLPLCSCSVLPTALALRKRGAGRGATVSFLVSTPETGVDSIALTYGLMDPLMAIYRPFAALVSALTAGFAAEAFGGREEPVPGTQGAAAEGGDKGADAGTAGESGTASGSDEDVPACDHCGPEADDRVPSAHSHGHAHDALEAEEGRGAAAPQSIRERLRSGYRGAFVEIFDETSHWMLAGLVISALIGVLLPAEIVTRYLGSGPVPLLLMLVIGIPLYICASASTPIAAALVLKGLSPGAALVFLLAGPATNIGSLAILRRFLGGRVTAVYLASVAVTALGLGILLDVVYQAFAVDPRAKLTSAMHLPLWFSGTCAVIFAALLFFSFRRAAPPGEFQAIGRGVRRLLGFRITGRLLGRAAALLAAIWVVSQFFVVVPPGHRALVQVFGKPTGGALGEGLHFRWPPPVGSVRLLSVDSVRRIELGFRSVASAEAAEAAIAAGAAMAGMAMPGAPSAPPAGGSPTTLRELEEESLFLTGDENLVDAKTVLQYRIVDPVRFAYAYDDPERTVKMQTVAEIVDVMAGMDIDALYSSARAVAEREVLEGVRRRCAEMDLGVEVIRFSILDVHAPTEVHAAFRDVASAVEDKRTAINVARRYEVETVNLARGEAAREVELARGFAV